MKRKDANFTLLEKFLERVTPRNPEEGGLEERSAENDEVEGKNVRRRFDWAGRDEFIKQHIRNVGEYQ